jgi:hypothetical protein
VRLGVLDLKRPVRHVVVDRRHAYGLVGEI